MELDRSAKTYGTTLLVLLLLISPLVAQNDSSGQGMVGDLTLEGPHLPETSGLLEDLREWGPPPAEFRELNDFIRKGAWGEAENTVNNLLLHSSQDPALLFWAGYIGFAQGQPLKAIPFLRKAEKRDPNLIDLVKILAVCYFEINQYILFEHQTRKAIELAPDDPDPHFFMGYYQLYIREANHAAIASFDRVLELRPVDYKAWYHRGRAYEVTEEKQKAHEHYLKAVALREKTPKSGFSLPYLGLARLLVDENPEQALRYGLKAVKIDPHLNENRLQVGKIYVRLERTPEAIATFKKASNLDPTATSPRYWLYRLYQNEGKKEQAEAILGEFVRLKKLYGRE